MSQNPITIPDTNGAQFLANLNAAIDTIVSNFSGTVFPATPKDWQFFANTGTGYLYQWNPNTSTWIVLGTLGLANFGINTTIPTGIMTDWIGGTPPSGWILLDGRTIGNASSSATNRANADTQALFTALWNAYPNSILGVSGGRGASAAADFAANKNITVPDFRGKTAVGRDNMGGTAANRVTNSTASPDGNTVGASGGIQKHQLVASEMPSHVHSVTGTTDTQGSHTHIYHEDTQHNAGPGGAGNFNGNGSSGGDNTTSTAGAHSHNISLSVGSTGGDGAHQNMPPFGICDKIVKL